MYTHIYMYLYMYMYMSGGLLFGETRGRAGNFAWSHLAKPNQNKLRKTVYFTCNLKVHCTQFANMWITQVHLVQVIR